MRIGLSVCLTIFMTLFLLQAQGQKSAKFWDPARDYKEALEIYDQGKYNIAYNKFHQFLERYEAEDEGKSGLLIADAHYYKASCASKQDDPKTEGFYLAYIDRFKGHSFNNSAYFDLGNLYFNKRDYHASLEYYNKVNEKALDKRFYEEFSFKRGFCYFSLKEFNTARLAWNDLIHRTDGEYYYEANYYYGMAAYFQENYDAAVAAFDVVDETARYKNVVPYYITQIHFIKADYEGVIDYAVPLVNDNGMKYRADMNQLIGQSYFEQGDYVNAVEYLADYVKQAKNVSKEDYYQLGFAEYQTLDYDGAVVSFKKLNHLNGALAQNALFLTGNAYLKLDDKENARTALKRAASLDFDAAIVEEARFNYAKLSYELNFNNDALVSLRKFINDYPSSDFSAEANEILADLLLNTKNYDEALAIIEKIDHPTPKITKAYQLMAYHKGISLYNEGRLNTALEAFTKSLRYTPDKSLQALTRYWMADIYHRKGNYAKSIVNMNHFLSASVIPDPSYTTKVSKSTGHYVQGYNHYKLSEYSKARMEFEKASNGLTTEANTEIQNQLLPDALLRTADCYYLGKDYNRAFTFYDKVINNGYDGSDYAIYQKALIDGIRGNYSKKIDLLKGLMNKYPESVLADDALFETGNTYIVMENMEAAIGSFDQLIRNHANSEWLPPARLKLGLIYFNQDKYDQALIQYKTVVSKYPKTTSSAEALTALRDVYIAKGDPQGYIQYLENVPGANVTMSEQDSILYLSAENLFTKGEYEKALTAFNDYLQRFPNGYFSLPAHFYRGECHFSFQDLDRAVGDYDKVLAVGANRFTERSLQRAASINYYHIKDYRTALEQYLSLMQQATTKDTRRTATLGILRSNFQLEEYRSSIEYADRVIADPSFPEQQHTESYFYRARSYWNTGDRSKGIRDYTVVKNRVSNEWAAEAVYHIALDHLESNRLEEAKSSCFLILFVPTRLMPVGW